MTRSARQSLCISFLLTFASRALHTTAYATLVVITALCPAAQGNHASAFGGGVQLGLLQYATCAFALNGSVVSHNTAGHAGAQVSSSCNGDLVVHGSRVEMQGSESEVGLTAV